MDNILVAQTASSTATTTITPMPICPPSFGDVVNSPFFVSVICVIGIGIVGVLISRFVLDPYFAYKKTVREIDSILILYANVFTRSVQMTDVISRPITGHFRRLASDFSSNYRDIPKIPRSLLISAGLLVSQDKRQEAQDDLISLANLVGDTVSPNSDPHRIMDHLKKILKIQS